MVMANRTAIGDRSWRTGALVAIGDGDPNEGLALWPSMHKFPAAKTGEVKSLSGGARVSGGMVAEAILALILVKVRTRQRALTHVNRCSGELL